MEETALPRPPARLYLVTPSAIELKSFVEEAKKAFSGGDVGCLQLRLKGANDDDILRAAEALIPLCHEHEAAFIMNDSPKLAKRAGADGVHLGQGDGPVKEARKILGNEAVIGVSCHDSKHLAIVAGEDGADYVAFGAFYPTTSKRPEELAKYGTPEADILEWWQAYMLLPCVAIGGMNPSNCTRLVAAGADFIAVIQAVWNNPEGPAKAVKAFNEAIQQALRT